MHGQSHDTNAFIADLAGRFQISESAVLAMLAAVKRGNGAMAQFDIGELGGNGQWMRGGMTMVGDMFNHGLKATVDTLCNTLSEALSSGHIDLPSETTGQNTWWPQWLGVPSSTGAQNDSAYAVFPSQRCLAIKDGSGITLYDTQDHLITGVGQQQGSARSQTFDSQRGSFSVDSLRRLETDRPSADQGRGDSEAAGEAVEPTDHGQSLSHGTPTDTSRARTPASQQASGPEGNTGASLEQRLMDAAETRSPTSSVGGPAAAPAAATSDGHQILALIEKLASLRTAGVLSEDEFAAKKSELLARL